MSSAARILPIQKTYVISTACLCHRVPEMEAVGDDIDLCRCEAPYETVIILSDNLEVNVSAQDGHINCL